MKDDQARQDTRIMILFYQARHQAYTIYLAGDKRIEGQRTFRSAERAVKYVNELMEQGHPVASAEKLSQLERDARSQISQ